MINQRAMEPTTSESHNTLRLVSRLTCSQGCASSATSTILCVHGTEKTAQGRATRVSPIMTKRCLKGRRTLHGTDGKMDSLVQLQGEFCMIPVRSSVASITFRCDTAPRRFSILPLTCSISLLGCCACLFRNLYNFTLLNRSEFAITDTELKLMAAAARIGLSRIPKNGYKTPAAIGTPSEL